MGDLQLSVHNTKLWRVSLQRAMLGKADCPSCTDAAKPLSGADLQASACVSTLRPSESVGHGHGDTSFPQPLLVLSRGPQRTLLRGTRGTAVDVRVLHLWRLHHLTKGLLQWSLLSTASVDGGR